MNISRDLVRSTLAVASLCALSLAQEPTPARTTDRPALPDRTEFHSVDDLLHWLAHPAALSGATTLRGV